jgi:glycosyltransferase involved in cell wall biosynthesis
MGAKVIRVDKPGLGNAYRAGKSIAKGKIVIMGDADCTYDFRNIAPFIEKIESGFDLVLGNRFIGNIEKGSMPIHHQYFGSPVTSWIFKKVLNIPTGDIHCGIRALRSDLYKDLPFTESGWEYASEMIAGARNLNAKITEIPVNFFKEPEGRISHQKRNGWMTPFRAGWGTLRVTTTFSFDRLLTIPGAILSVVTLATGAFIALAPESTKSNLKVGLLAQFILFSLTVVGSLAFSSGSLVHFIYYKESRIMKFLSRQNVVESIFGITAILTLITLGMILRQLIIWISNWNMAGVSLIEITSDRLFSIFVLMSSLSICCFSLLIVSMVSNYLGKLSSIDKR